MSSLTLIIFKYLIHTAQ